MEIKRKIEITNKSGLHARPAAVFVQTANKFNSDISISKGKQTVNGKSIMGILMLAAESGSTVELKASGEDAERAIEELAGILVKEGSTEKDQENVS